LSPEFVSIQVYVSFVVGGMSIKVHYIGVLRTMKVACLDAPRGEAE